MKKIIYTLLAGVLFVVANPSKSVAQSLSVTADTLTITSGTSFTLIDTIVNSSASTIPLEWQIVATDFPASWLAATGLCDLCNCYGVSATAPTADVHTCAYPSGDGDFHLQADLTGLVTGCYYLTIRGRAIATPTDSVTITFMVCSPTTSVGNTISTREIRLYPNPVMDMLTVEVPGIDKGDRLLVTDIAGAVVATQLATESLAPISIDMNNLAPGIYFARIVTVDGKAVQAGKFVKE